VQVKEFTLKEFEDIFWVEAKYGCWP
jgi:hypothetical protein